MAYTSSRLEKLKTYLSESSQKSSDQDPAHLFGDHIMRVYQSGIEIGIEEKANLEILAPALLLHDLIRPTDKKGESDHALRSAEYARKILPNFNYSEDEIDAISNAIVTSSRSGGNYEIPNTLEAKIVYDADKLDGGGEIGIRRAQQLWKKRFELEGKPYQEKTVADWYLGRIVDALKVGLFTRSAKELMGKRLEVSLRYCEDFLGSEYVNQKLGDLKTKLNLETK